MPAVPRAASAWLSESVPGRLAWGRPQRLLKSADFSRVSSSQSTWRFARSYLAARALVFVPGSASGAGEAAQVRIGTTVARRFLKRAVARNVVKRIVREAARHAHPGLMQAAGPRSVHLVLQLKKTFPAIEAMGLGALKALLRAEAEALLRELRERLAAPAAAAGMAQSGQRDRRRQAGAGPA